MNDLISIIVPVCNVEKYLKKCVDSILNQTYRNIEVILIDDGSPDNCGKICDEYAQQDSRVKVMHIKNGGVSNARNIGIEMSVGQYIGFVDSDDVISEEMYEKLLQVALENNADIVQCNYCYLFEDDHTENMERKINNKKIDSVDEVKRAFINGLIYPSVATKLFKKEIVRNIRFNTALKVAEDRLFVFECCCKSSKVVLIDDVLYYYFQRENSAIHIFDIKQFEDDTYVSKIFIENHLMDADIVKCLENRCVNQCVRCVSSILRTKKYENKLSDVRRELLIYGKRALFRKEISLKTRICALCIWLLPSLFYKMYSLFVKLKGIEN